MALFRIKGNALDFQRLMTCISATKGTKGQNIVKDDLIDRLLETWPEMDMARENVTRIDDRSKEALKTREMEIDTVEQGVLAECFLDVARDKNTLAGDFRQFRKAAKMIKVGKWFDGQCKETLPHFAGKADDPAPTAYSDGEPEAADQTPKTA